MKKAISILTAVAILSINITACKKDGNSSEIAPTSRKVEYKVTSSLQTTISSVVYTGVDGTAKKVIPVRSSKWSSGILDMPNSVNTFHLTAHAPGLNQVPAMTLNVQIYVDGVLKKEQTTQGPDENGDMLAATTY